MKWENALDELLAEANPSIKYRIYRDILKESQSMKMERLYAEVLQDPQVKYAFSLQRADGYFGDVFHAGFIPKGSHYGKSGTEGIMRFLFEKGIEPSAPRIRAGLEALRRDSWLGAGERHLVRLLQGYRHVRAGIYQSGITFYVWFCFRHRNETFYM